MKLEGSRKKVNPKDLLASLKVKSPESKAKHSTTPTGSDTNPEQSTSVVDLTRSPLTRSSASKRSLLTPTTSQKKKLKETTPLKPIAENPDTPDSGAEKTDQHDPVGLQTFAFSPNTEQHIQELFRTPPDTYGVRVDGLSGYLNATPAAAASQREQMRLAIPNLLRHEFQRLSAVDAHNNFVQNFFMAFNSAFDMIARGEQVFQALEIERANLAGERAKLSTSEQHCADLSAQLAASKAAADDFKQQLLAAQEAKSNLQAENKVLSDEAIRLNLSHNNALSAKKAAEEEFKKLRQHLPTLSFKILNSKIVERQFGAYADALSVRDKVDFWDRVRMHFKIEDPLPADIAEDMCSAEDAELLLTAAKEGVADIPIHQLTVISENDNTTADDIIKLDLSVE